MIDFFLAVESAIRKGESFTIVDLRGPVVVAVVVGFGAWDECDELGAKERSGWNSGNLTGGVDDSLGVEVVCSALFWITLGPGLREGLREVCLTGSSSVDLCLY